MSAGDRSVILGMDHNDDVRTGELTLQLKGLDLIDSIISQHSASSTPATFNRNTTRIPIDALWVSPNVGAFMGRILRFRRLSRNAVRSLTTMD